MVDRIEIKPNGEKYVIFYTNKQSVVDRFAAES
jgi:hypothetical protein